MRSFLSLLLKPFSGAAALSNPPRLAAVALCSLVLAACGAEQNGVSSGGPASAQGMTQLDVYMTRTCGCCGAWVDHADANGFQSEIHYLEQDELTAEKMDRGIGFRLQSCHTAVSEEGYVFEGHVPARLIHDFLADVPDDAIGLAVPGMPMGSPGMEMGDRFDPYDVVLIRDDGSTDVYSHMAEQDQQY